MQSLETLATKKQFDVIRQDRRELLPFVDHYALLDTLHDPAGDADGKDAVLSALVATSQRSAPGRDIAVILLWMALWPGLDAVYRRLARHFTSEPGDLVSEISERFSVAVHRLNLIRVNRIAATLLRNVERDIRAGLRSRWDESARRGEMPADDTLSSSGSDAETATAAISRMLTTLIGNDAGLVVAVAIRGEDQREAARRLGLSHDAARKRFQRALRRLREIAEIL